MEQIIIGSNEGDPIWIDHITYKIRVDSRDPETIWIDQLAGGELDRTYGPFWSIYSARELIERWQQEEAP
jgi:hypothetical protein